MKKTKLKKKAKISLFLFLFIAIGIIILVLYIKKINSFEYKLEKIGYSKNEITEIVKLNNKDINNYILSKKINNKNIIFFVKEKYFMFKNIEQYLTYKKQNDDKSYMDIVAIINVGVDKTWYEEPKKADLNQDFLILVNKFYYLEKDYERNDIVDISNWYSYEGNKISSSVYDAYKSMWNKAKEDNLTLIVTAGYRPYDRQEKIYNEYADIRGEEYANKYAAKPGFSEHQTALALDIFNFNSTMENFDQTEEFKWLEANAHKYGFILRYPKGKEYLTGYDYEPWHFRYVGIDVATQIYNENITFDEYYAYYIEK